MRLCDCDTGPLRDTAHPDQLRCLRCGWWTPHGALPSHERVTLLAREAASILTQFAEDYAWAHSVSFAPPRRSNGVGGRSGQSDPTGNAVADPIRIAVRTRTTIAARLLERVMRDLRSADEAIGDALLAAEPPGPVDHTPAPFHDPATLFPGRPDLAEAHAAQARRHARGEGVPT